MARDKPHRSDEAPYDQIQTSASRAAPGRSTPFQDAHQLQYGLRIFERQPDVGVVISVACRFCISFGREEKVGAKRKQTANTKYFKKPFRPEHYRQHLVNQHPARWANYQQLPQAKKRECFDERKLLRSSILAFANEKQAPIVVPIDRAIIDIIVSQVLLDDDDNDMPWKQTMTGLHLNDSESQYILTIKNPVQFYLIVDYLSVGMSFRMALSVLTKTKNRTGLASIGSCSPGLPSKYARFVCAMNLQKITQMLSEAWMFSIALDMSTHMSISYLDTRIRVYHNHKLTNLHLLAIPMSGSHTAGAMFDAIVQVLDVICPVWKVIMLGVTSDGERKMTGHNSGLATRLQNVCASGFMRVWCGLHQLDLVLQKSFKVMMGGEFYGYMTQTIAHLRRQKTLINQMKTTSPLLQDTRWESMARCCKWFKTHRTTLTAYLNDANRVCKPPDNWWLLLTLVDKLPVRSVITFRSLEGRVALITEKEAEFKRFSSDLQGLFGGSLRKTNVVSTDHERQARLVHSDDGTISVDPKYLICSGMTADSPFQS